jgi:mannose-1-phosphate guanylyltransferase
MAQHGERWDTLTVAVLTADHAISPDEAFRATVARAMGVAEETRALVTIGIPPTRPATEYGYIETGDAIGEGAWSARGFKEKPDSETASTFVASGRMLWNSGMFFWTLRAFMDELTVAQPAAAEVCERVAAMLAAGDEAGAAKAFAELPSISIDYALMEHASNVAVVGADFSWDDLGSWDALSRSLEGDAAGNVVQGEARLVESKGCVVYNDVPDQRVTVLGLEDVVVAVTDGEVLVCRKDRSQDVRGLAD